MALVSHWVFFDFRLSLIFRLLTKKSDPIKNVYEGQLYRSIMLLFYFIKVRFSLYQISFSINGYGIYETRKNAVTSNISIFI